MKRASAVTSPRSTEELFVKIKKELSKKNFWELLRYLIVGGIGALSYLFFSNLYNWLSVPTYLSPFYAWLSGLVLVYFGHMKFTYRVKAQHKQMAFRFMVMQSYNLGMSTFSTVIVREWLKWPYFIASLFALATTVPILFILGKYWVYQSSKNTHLSS